MRVAANTQSCRDAPANVAAATVRDGESFAVTTAYSVMLSGWDIFSYLKI